MKLDSTARKLAGALALAVALAPLAPTPAFADTVTNNVTVGGNDTTTVGSTTTVSYLLNKTKDEGENGNKCNASALAPVSIAVSVAVPTGTTATVSPATLSFTDCVTVKDVSLGASKAGEYTVSVSTSAASVSTSAAAFTLKVRPAADTAGPVLTLPSDQVVEAAGGSGTALSYTATAFDAGDGKATAVTCTPASGSTFPIRSTAVACSSTDSKGNGSTGGFNVSVVDSTGPVLSLSDTTAEATSASGAPVSFTATASDAVDGTRPVACTPASGSQFALGTTTVSCSSTDSRNNGATGTLKVTVQDKTAPSLTLPTTTVKQEAAGSSGAPVTYAASASDLVDGLLAPICTPASGATFPLGTTTVGCSVNDKAGNVATGSFVVTVGDTTAPTLMRTDVVAEATAPDGADVKYTATASDVVDGAITPSCTPGSGSTFALGTTAVSCSATDARSNTAMGTLNVTVKDSTAPSLQLADETVEATGANGAAVTYAASASDLVSGALAVTCSKVSGATFALGATTVTCSATDAAKNTATGTFVVSVKDRTAPTLLLANQEKEATSAAGAPVAFVAGAIDLVDGSVTPSCDRASGSTFPLGSSTVTCTVTDQAGNKGSDTFTVAVVDTTAPAIAAASKTVEATGPKGATVTYSATASDLVDGDVTPICDIASGTVFPLGDTTVTCRATDSRNNFDTKIFTITVADTTPPEITSTDVTAEATSPQGAAVTYVAGATDLVDGAVPVTCTPASGSTFALGASTVTCSAADSRSNRASAIAKITVQDTTGPALQLTEQTLEATGPGGATASFVPTATDLVSGSRPVFCDKESGATFPIGATTVTCKAADALRNASEGTFTITVGDKTAPSLELTDAKAEATKQAGADVTYKASASDVVDGPRPVECNPASGTTFAITTTQVACSASDTRNNLAKGTLNVTVTDSTPPSLTLTDQKAEATSANGAVVRARQEITQSS